MKLIASETKLPQVMPGGRAWRGEKLGLHQSALLPNSLRKFRERALLFPPCEGGAGGWAGEHREHGVGVPGVIER